MTLNLKKAFFSLMLVLAGCDGGGGNSPPPGPSITIQPLDTVVYAGDSATFSVEAHDSGPVTFQWKKNGTPIPGATSAQYTTAATNLTDDDTRFSVEIKGPLGIITRSLDATLTVKNAAPFITTAPTPQTVLAGHTVQFSVSADGRPELTYQWKKNGTDIAGANQSSYIFTAAMADNGANYTVIISNAQGHITSDPVTLSVVEPQINLLISEVSNCVDICWFEIYNPTRSAIDLSTYRFKSPSVDISVKTPTIGTTVFSLPNIQIEPDGHVVVAGNRYGQVQRGSQHIKIIDGSTIPYWEDSGFIELLKADDTVDFVRFGSSTQAPASGTWDGDNVAALPLATTNTDFGKSIVRPFNAVSGVVDSNSAADWISVDWVTPGGRNDIGADVADSDSDGIPDSAEVSGGTYGGLDLYAMGARVGMRDIFIELDYMNSTDPGIVPRKAALQKVVDAFSAQGIKLWIDAGTTYNASFSQSDFNLGQGNPVVPFERCVSFDSSTCTGNTSDRKTIYDWKAEYMDLRRLSVFHYVLFGNSQLANGGCGSGGIAEINGNDVIVSLGGCNTFSANTTYPYLFTNYQSATLMHELGHNLGLLHGGDEETNYKPNYWSVMNYMYAYGLAPDPSASTAYQRWNFYANASHTLNELCGNRWITVASPCGNPANFVIDYSNGTGTDLDENALYESDNLGRGRLNNTAYADWNRNGSLDNNALSIDLSKDNVKTTLRDFDDWSHLVLPFSRFYAGNNGPALFARPRRPALNPISNDRQPVSVEEATLPRLLGH